MVDEHTDAPHSAENARHVQFTDETGTWCHFACPQDEEACGRLALEQNNHARPLNLRCLVGIPGCNCDGSPLTIGGPMPTTCEHVHDRDDYRWTCPTCGPTEVEAHPRRVGGTRCANCKEWLNAPPGSAVKHPRPKCGHSPGHEGTWVDDAYIYDCHVESSTSPAKPTARPGSPE